MNTLNKFLEMFQPMGISTFILLSVLFILFLASSLFISIRAKQIRNVISANVKLVQEYHLSERQRKSLQEKNERLSREIVEIKKHIRTRDAKGRFEKKNK